MTIATIPTHAAAPIAAMDFIRLPFRPR